MRNVRAPKYIFDLAKKMRLSMTETERILWDRLKKKKIDGFKFRRQHPINRYIVDFYCHKKKLAIEIDGDIHDDRKDYDLYRDTYLESNDIKTIRFNAAEVKKNIDTVVYEIIKYLNEDS